MKKIYVAALILSMTVLLSACGGGTDAGSGDADGTPVENTAGEDQGENEETQKAEEPEDAAPEENDSADASEAETDATEPADTAGGETAAVEGPVGEVLGTYYYAGYDDGDGVIDGDYGTSQDLETMPKIVFSKSGNDYVMTLTDMAPELQSAMGLSEAECSFTVDGESMGDALVIPSDAGASEWYFEDVEFGGVAFRMFAQHLGDSEATGQIENIQLKFSPALSGSDEQYFIKVFDEAKLQELMSQQ